MAMVYILACYRAVSNEAPLRVVACLPPCSSHSTVNSEPNSTIKIRSKLKYGENVRCYVFYLSPNFQLKNKKVKCHAKFGHDMASEKARSW